MTVTIYNSDYLRAYSELVYATKEIKTEHKIFYLPFQTMKISSHQNSPRFMQMNLSIRT